MSIEHPAQDSNLQPLGPQSNALIVALHSRCWLTQFESLNHVGLASVGELAFKVAVELAAMRFFLWQEIINSGNSVVVFLGLVCIRSKAEINLTGARNEIEIPTYDFKKAPSLVGFELSVWKSGRP